MNHTTITKLSAESQQWLSRLCLERFGSMNKNDYEVAIFHALLENGYREKSDFYISQALRIPETKVKRLRYESDLVYTPGEDLKEKLKRMLCEQHLKEENGRIYILIKDKLLRQYANDLLEESHYFADGSFRTDVISLTATDLLALLCLLYGKEDYLEKVQDIKRQLVVANKPLPSTASEKVKGCAKSILKDVADKAAPQLTRYLTTNILGTATIDENELTEQ